MKFTGTKSYIATDDLSLSVNAAIALERPLLIKGAPGTGKIIFKKENSGRHLLQKNKRSFLLMKLIKLILNFQMIFYKN